MPGDHNHNHQKVNMKNHFTATNVFLLISALAQVGKNGFLPINGLDGIMTWRQYKNTATTRCIMCHDLGFYLFIYCFLILAFFLFSSSFFTNFDGDAGERCRKQDVYSTWPFLMINWCDMPVKKWFRNWQIYKMSTTPRLKGKIFFWSILKGGPVVQDVCARLSFLKDERKK